MRIEFSKYHGTGNDFIIIDDRDRAFSSLTGQVIRKLCDRRFGIGADGLIFLREHEEFDFRMVYHNADGGEGTMCGNGGRCAVAFANRLKLIGASARFMTIDGLHEASVLSNGTISLGMNKVSGIQPAEEGYRLDTGSPHLVLFRRDIDLINVYEEGHRIRYSPPYMPGGINVNFVEEDGDGIHVRTYERGVENETLSCGTGNVASAVCNAFRSGNGQTGCRVRTAGGDVMVRFTRNGDEEFNDILLEGTAVHVFDGTINTEEE